MSQIKLDNTVATTAIETLRHGAGFAEALSAGATSFNAHLQWAQTRNNDAASSAPPSIEHEPVSTTDGSRASASKASFEPADRAPRPAESRTDESAQRSPGPEHRDTSNAPAQAPTDHNTRPSGADDHHRQPNENGASAAAAQDTEEKTALTPDKKPAATSETNAEQDKTVHKDKEKKDKPAKAGKKGAAHAAPDPNNVPASAATSLKEKPEEDTLEEQPHAANGTNAATKQATAKNGSLEKETGPTGAKPVGTGAAAKESLEPQPTGAIPATAEAGSAATTPDQPTGPATQDKSKVAATIDRSFQQATEQAANKTPRHDSAADEAQPPSTEDQLAPRAQRPESKKDSRAARSKQMAAEQTEPSATTASPTVDTKTNAVKTPVEQVVAVVEQQTKNDETSVKSPSGDNGTSQSALSATDRPASASQATSSARTAEGTDLGQADRVRFVQRVAQAFQTVGDRGGGTVRLRLSPPELGSVRLEISVRNGTMTAHAQAENETTRNLLLDNLGALRDRLSQQNIRIDQFHVDLMDHSPGGFPQQTANQSQSQQQGSGYQQPRGGGGNHADAGASTISNPARRLSGGSQLDVLV
jgi:flagellar hook-length control protein FliK